MAVLLEKRKQDKKEIEDNVQTNVKKLIEPYFKKIKNTKLDDQQKVLIGILESNLKEISSPFTRKMSLKHLELTPKEIQVALLIKEGKTTKEIALLLNASRGTIEFHRNSLRKKLGLTNTRTNLRSYLLSI